MQSYLARAKNLHGKDTQVKIHTDNKQLDSEDDGCGLYAAKNDAYLLKGRKRKVGVTHKDVKKMQKFVKKFGPLAPAPPPLEPHSTILHEFV